MLNLDRRRFLNSASLALTLPILESSVSRTKAATEARAANVKRDAEDSAPAKRLVVVGTYLGFYQPDFFPKKTGNTFDLPNVLKPLQPFRNELSIFSGLDHRGRNGHEGWKAWMTGSATGSVSLDQLVADKIGDRTRFASLQVTCGNPPGAAKLSFTKEGVALPMIGRPSVLFRSLFRAGSDKARINYLLTSNRSVLDDVLGEAKRVERELNSKDQHKLREYMAAVRDVERKLQKQKDWLDRTTPHVDYKLPEFDPVAPDLALECESIMYDLMSLALTTDVTRVLTFLVPGWSQVFTIDGQKLSAGYHGLSHHGNDPAKIAEYNAIGLEHVSRFGRFLKKIKHSKDMSDRSLLDSTTVVFGSGMGDANTHDNSNLPTLVVGGSMRHGNHHRIDRNAPEAKRLGDLYLTVMQQLGISKKSFAGARQNLNELLI